LDTKAQKKDKKAKLSLPFFNFKVGITKCSDAIITN